MATTIESVLNDMKRLLSALLLREQRKEQKDNDQERDGDSGDETAGKESDSDEKAKKKQDDKLAKDAEKNLRDKNTSDRRLAEEEKDFLGGQRKRYDQIGSNLASFLVSAAQSLIPPQFQRVASDVATVGSGIVRLGHAAIQEEQLRERGVHESSTSTMEKFFHSATKNVTNSSTSMQPRGTDTVPAMLTPGEFVVNARAAKDNLPLLNQINSGSGHATGGPIYRATGGPVYRAAGGTLSSFVGNVLTGVAKATAASYVPPEVVDTVATGFTALKDALFGLPSALLESQRAAAEFSTDLGKVFGQMRAREIVRLRGYGEQTGETTARLGGAYSDLEDALIPIRVTIQNVLNEVAIPLANGMTRILDYLNQLLPAAKVPQADLVGAVYDAAVEQQRAYRRVFGEPARHIPIRDPFR